jgi:hypothetical protein
MVEQEPEEGVALFLLEPDDSGGKARVDEESLFPSNGVNADDWVLWRERRSGQGY